MSTGRSLVELKSIEAHLQSGITNLTELQDALQTAVQLEFSTIPPYLCALWSIDADPSAVSSEILNIVVQEMFHFAMAGNILSAIGRAPTVATADFLPRYPAATLPGGIVQDIPVDLLPLTPSQLEVFMQIEKPDFPPIAFDRLVAPASIGAFYREIADAVNALQPTFNTQAKFISMGEAKPIVSAADAVAAISVIRGEGEGTENSPDQPPPNSTDLAHYYQFKQILRGRRLQQTNAQWDFTGDPIVMPTSHAFAPAQGDPHPAQNFMLKLKGLLVQLEGCWVTGGRPSMRLMNELRDEGLALITQGITPEFRWPTAV